MYNDTSRLQCHTGSLQCHALLTVCTMQRNDWFKYVGALTKNHAQCTIGPPHHDQHTNILDLFVSVLHQKANTLQHFSDSQICSTNMKIQDFPIFFGSVGQPSLVGYPGPIQSTQDNRRSRKWRNENEI